MTTHTDSERVQTLAVLEANAGNVSLTSRETGVPRATVRLWRDTAVAHAPELSPALSVAATVKTDWADLYGEAAQLGAGIIRENLERYQGTSLSPSDLRNVAVVAGISVDKHLDYRDGRKSAQVNVDARSVNLTQLSDEQLAKLNESRES